MVRKSSPCFEIYIVYPNSIPIGTGTQNKNGYRNFKVNSNSKSVRDCMAIIERDVGFAPVSPRAGNSPVIPLSVGKFVVSDRLAGMWMGPTKEYYECIRENDNLNQQKILSLTRQVSLLASR